MTKQNSNNGLSRIEMNCRSTFANDHLACVIKNHFWNSKVLLSMHSRIDWSNGGTTFSNSGVVASNSGVVAIIHRSAMACFESASTDEISFQSRLLRTSKSRWQLHRFGSNGSPWE
jgi:hypothetical protein